ncbi:MAG: ATP-dependent DNA helicase RecG [Candidatus Omnitrophica bacterium]|nr:ATP-dependent DNA helicase RecG [Candidatus Omnitrophota bacterium]
MKTESIPQINGKPVRYLRGIGPKRCDALRKFGIETLHDLFYLFPRRYEDRGQFKRIKDLRVNEFAAIKGKVITLGLRPMKRFTLFELVLEDESGSIFATWFNQPYLKKNFKVGDEVILSGKVDFYKRLQLTSPEYEILDGSSEDTTHTGRIVPIYPLTEGLAQRSLRRSMKELVDNYLTEIGEILPPAVAEKENLMPLADALKAVHFPVSLDEVARARYRLVFDEFFLLELEVLRRTKTERKKIKAHPIPVNDETIRQFKELLPFKLTNDQEKVVKESLDDLRHSYPMRRLLEGEVGSGKTVVAACLAYCVARNHLQTAFMVPTEILAEQHFLTLTKLLQKSNLRVALLTSSSIHRKEIIGRVKRGEVDIVVGTHALIQEDVSFRNLGFVIIDEQHKFGVRQRTLLLNHDTKPHLLVMSATPIPRTLGLTLYGDLEISVIRELPKGRGSIRTFWITRAKEKEVLRYIHDRVSEGEQAYIIFPIIDETEKMDLQAATTEYEKLRTGLFKGIPMGLIHGRLEKTARDKVMEQFQSGEIKVIVATSVIEVGIDNPRSSFMIIEHADRFGLSQLHQMRGRIGRGGQDAQCFLFGDPTTEEGKKRLRVLTKSNDGFKIAEEDLRLRGPGDFLGTRQSGVPFFRIADLIEDAPILARARRAADDILEADPHLRREENSKLIEAAKRYVTLLD